MVLLLPHVLSALAFTALSPLLEEVSAKHLDRNHIQSLRNKAAEKLSKNRLAVVPGGDVIDVKVNAGVKNITFSNPAASAFYVDGATIPDVDWDIGPSWAGLLPISGNANETRELFFWFFPPGPTGANDSLILWTNGGPGCSSLEGMLQEHGPFSWGWGQYKPTVNEHSWTNLSSILYIEHPVGTGYSQGIPNVQDEEDVATQFVGFLQQFLEVFAELKGKKTYLTGESYAGMYVPYIADYIYKKKVPLDLSLQGIWIGDPILGWDVVQEEIPVVDFVHKYEHVFAFNQTFMKYLDEQNKKCNYAGYLDKHLKYPPKGPLPLPGQSVEADPDCDLWTEVYEAALILNPAFNVYRIFDQYPLVWDVLGFPEATESPIYFDRQDVKKAIHAPLNQTWVECANIDVFPNGDASLPPAFTVLPGVIEQSVRSVIMHGLGDYVLIAEGARLVLQNMTWGGKQGFQKAPAPDSFIVEDMGAMGTVQIERKLGYFEVVLSGHMLPQFVPKAAFQSMQWLFGIRQNP
ncbi:alpha/beta-hydrolase [Thelephora terrestris]|uniref:Carboxypeptidase n=1 Tax=Thelephora terrestris TaxID=56493 RepID=A0A9P6L301_9AGAM|nr:alpha/beta-hydrolase [Thelephora terrestris]